MLQSSTKRFRAILIKHLPHQQKLTISYEQNDSNLPVRELSQSYKAIIFYSLVDQFSLEPKFPRIVGSCYCKQKQKKAKFRTHCEINFIAFSTFLCSSPSAYLPERVFICTARQYVYFNVPMCAHLSERVFTLCSDAIPCWQQQVTSTN